MDRLKKLVRWFSVATAAILMTGGASVASALTITKAIGIVAGNDLSEPYTYVVASDGNLWLNIYNGSNYSWTNLNTPSGVSLGIPVGTTLNGHTWPYAFITGSDGNLWVDWWQSTFHWGNLGKPTGVTLTMGIGATQNGSGNPMAFVLGSDGNVWLCYWTGSSWAWYDQGHPSGVNVLGTSGAVFNSGGNPMAFIVGSDGNLWQNYWNGSNWGWYNVGHPPTATVAQGYGTSGSHGGNYVTAMVVGSDGHSWYVQWNGSWTWTNDSAQTVSKPVGTSSDGHEYYFSGIYMFDGPINNGCISATIPCQGAISPDLAIGAVAVPNIDYAAVTGSDGLLWLHQFFPATGGTDWKDAYYP